MASINTPAFADLLRQAVTLPGTLSKAYQNFHQYSLGNVLLAWSQCAAREIQLGPMATYVRWKELGRHVKRGETALTLCQPVTIRRKEAEAGGEAEYLIRFTFRNRWFVLAQTDGAELPPADPPGWDKARALAALDITEIPFDLINGNILGYAKDRNVSVSPVNPLPFKTLFHELAHVLLGHTAESVQAESEVTPQSLREAEAESVALLCCEALALPGAEESRGYIQHWYGQNPIPERSAQRILRVADQILRAGQSETASESDDEGGRP